MEPGILPDRIGGLGNQLFIVVAGYICSKVHRVPLYILDMVCEAHQTVKEDYKKSIFSFFGIHIESCESSYKSYSPEGFSPWSPQDISPGTKLSSYFQYYPPILPYEEEIRSLILKGLDFYLKSLSQLYTGSYAFVHIRRGDYLQHTYMHYVQPIEYYKRAISLLDDSVQIIVFSDDIDWVESQEYFKEPRFNIQRNLNELETLSLMSLCKEGAICSNSTFSWWGAYLGTHAQRNKVIVPEEWINSSYFDTESWLTCPSGAKVPNLFPKEWIILSN